MVENEANWRGEREPREYYPVTDLTLGVWDSLLLTSWFQARSRILWGYTMSMDSVPFTGSNNQYRYSWLLDSSTACWHHDFRLTVFVGSRQCPWILFPFQRKIVPKKNKKEISAALRELRTARMLSRTSLIRRSWSSSTLHPEYQAAVTSIATPSAISQRRLETQSKDECGGALRTMHVGRQNEDPSEEGKSYRCSKLCHEEFIQWEKQPPPIANEGHIFPWPSICTE